MNTEEQKSAKTITMAGISDDRRATLVNWTCWNCERLHKKEDMLFLVKVISCEKCGADNIINTKDLA